jgi:hypothetical protein
MASVQIGSGTNTSPNTVQFFGTCIFSNGMLRVESLDMDALKAALAEDNTYAMFEIPLNYNISEGWKGVVLKASTNNFMNGNNDIVYYTDPNLSGEGDPEVDAVEMYVTNSNEPGTNNRSLVYISDPLSYNGDIGNIVLLVNRDMLLPSRGNGKWLSSSNDGLVWVYCRTKEDDYEKDSSNNLLWRSVMPIRWFSSRPSWAKNIAE